MIAAERHKSKEPGLRVMLQSQIQRGQDDQVIDHPPEAPRRANRSHIGRIIPALNSCTDC